MSEHTLIHEPARRLRKDGGMNGGVTELLLPTALAAWRRRPNHLCIKPD